MGMHLDFIKLVQLHAHHAEDYYNTVEYETRQTKRCDKL